jgi:large subunit ribosomal protein L4
MATLDVYDLKKNKVGEIEVNDAVFAAAVNESLIYEYVKMQDAGHRGGNAKTKCRGEVSGGGKKPYRQKGTGRARQGSTRAPHYVGGGTVFGPSPRKYDYKLPRKARQGAIRSVLSLRARDSRLIVVEDFKLDAVKTKVAAGILRGTFGLRSALIVDSGGDDVLRKSVRNIHGFKVLPSAGVNVRDVLLHDTLIMTRRAVAQLERRLAS